MRFSAFMLVACLSGAGTITIANTSFADKSGAVPETNLARGRFQRAVFNRDGTRLLTATAKLARLWDLNTGAMLQKFEGHAAYIHSICFSPDEQQVLTGAGKGVEHGRNDPSVRLWDASTGKLITVMTTVGKELVDEIGMSSAYRVKTARYSPNGQQALSVMSSSNGYPNAVVLWNLKTNDIDLVLSRIITASGTLVIGDPVQFSPDGKWLSGFVNEASQVVIWNAGTGAVRWRFSISDDAKQNENDSRFELTQWSPSGRFVLAASSDRTVNVWDVSNGGKIQRLQGHDGRIQFAAFFSNDTQVLTASEDGSVRLWDTQSGEQLRQWDYSGPVQQASVSPDGERLLTVTFLSNPTRFLSRWFGELRNLKTGESIRKWELPPVWVSENQSLIACRSPIMNSSGRLVLTSVWEDREVRVILIDAVTGAVKKTYSNSPR